MTPLDPNGGSQGLSNCATLEVSAKGAAASAERAEPTFVGCHNDRSERPLSARDADAGHDVKEVVMPRPNGDSRLARALPARANFEQLKKQAKDLLAAYRAGEAVAVEEIGRYEQSPDPGRFALHDARRVLARSYGFASWSKLKEQLGRPRVRMIRPQDIRSDVWETITAAATGDEERLRALLARDPGLAREGYWYTPPLHVAVREGHLAAVRVLLEAGADPAGIGLIGDDLVTTARDRGLEEIARVLESAAERRQRTSPAGAGAPDYPIHVAAAADDVESVRRLLDAEPDLVYLGDRKGGTPLHRAVAASARRAVEVLLERGADVHALHGRGRGDAAGYAPADFQPIDLALWKRGDLETARLLVARGAAYDLAVAAALGDGARVTALLDENPERIREARPCGTRALPCTGRRST